MSDIDLLTRIATGIEKLVSNQGGNSAAGGKGGGAIGENQVAGVRQIAEAAVPAAIGMMKFAKGTDVATLAVDAVSAAASKLPLGLGALGSMVSQVGGELVRQKNVLDEVNRETGAAGQNIGRFMRMSGEAGLTTEQFGALIKAQGPNIAGFGTNATLAAENFSKVQKGVLESNIGADLQRAGVSAQELAQYTAQSMAAGRRRDMMTTAGQEAIQKSALQFATQLVDISSATGQSREQVAKNSKEIMESTDVFIMMQGMGKKAGDSFQGLVTQIGGQNSAAAKTVAELYQYDGVRTKATNDMVTAMGVHGTSLMENTAKLKLANERGDEAEAKRLQREIEINVIAGQKYAIERANQAKGIENLDAGTKEATQRMLSDKASQTAYRSRMAAIDEAGGNIGEALDRQAEEAERGRKGQNVATGEVDEGTNTARAMNEMNRRATIAAGGFAQTMEQLNKEVGSNAGVMSAMRTAMAPLGAPNGTMDQFRDKLIKTPEQLKQGFEKIFGLNASGENKQPKNQDASGNYIPKRSGGTMAETGSPIEPADAVVQLHKGESVFSPEATAKLGKNMAPPAAGGVDVAGISSAIKTTFSSTQPASPQDDIRAKNEELKKKAEEALKIISDAGEGSFKTNIRINQSGYIRLTEQFEENGNRAQSLGQESAEERIAELIAQAERIKTAQTAATVKEGDAKTASIAELIERDKGNIQNSTAKIAEIKDMTTAELIERDKGNIQNSTAEASQTLLAEFNKMSTDLGADPAKLGELKKKVDAAYKDTEFGDLDGAIAKQQSVEPKPVETVNINPEKMFGNMFGNIAANIGKIQQEKTSKVTQVTAAKQDLNKKDPSKMTPAELAERDKQNDPRSNSAVKQNQKEGITASETSLKDLNDQLLQLNKQMGLLIDHNKHIDDSTAKMSRAKAPGQR